MISSTTRRRIPFLAALGAALALAACSGDALPPLAGPDDGAIGEPGSDPEGEAGVGPDGSDGVGPEEGDGVGPDGTDVDPGGAEPDGTDRGSTDPGDDDPGDDDPGDDDPGDDDPDEAAGDARITVDWPEGWEDRSDEGWIPQAPLYQEVHFWGETRSGRAGSASITRYTARMWGTGGYLDLLERTGSDPSEYTEIGEREIDGYTVMGYRYVDDLGTGTFVQQLSYGFEVADGSFVEIVLTAVESDADFYAADFAQILDTVSVD